MELKLDPRGYFLIKIDKNKIYLGFCEYQNKNKIIKQNSSNSIKTLLKWAKTNNLYTLKTHKTYLERELKQASLCLKTNKEYMQK